MMPKTTQTTLDETEFENWIQYRHKNPEENSSNTEDGIANPNNPVRKLRESLTSRMEQGQDRQLGFEDKVEELEHMNKEYEKAKH